MLKVSVAHLQRNLLIKSCPGNLHLLQYEKNLSWFLGVLILLFFVFADSTL
jgi:hypothetical protein